MVKMKYLICEYCGIGIASSTGKIPKELRLQFASDHIDCKINHPKKKKIKSLYQRFLRWIK